MKTVGLKRLLLVVTTAISLLFAAEAWAATITSTAAGGTWATGSTWIGGLAPGAADSAVIAGPVTVIANTACTGLTVNAAQALTFNNNIVLTVNGDVTGTGTLIGGNGGATRGIVLRGDWTFAGAIVSRLSLTLDGTTDQTFNGSSGFRNFVVNKTSGTANLVVTPMASGSVSLNAGAINYGGGAQDVLATNHPGNVTLSGSGAKNLQVGTAAIAGNLTLGGTATATTADALTVGGNLVIGNGTTFTAAGFNLTVSGTTTLGGGASGSLVFSSVTGAKTFTGLVTVNSGATWNNLTNEAIDFRGGLTNNGTFNAGTGIYTFVANNQAIGGSATAIADLTVQGVTLTNNISSGAGLTVGTALSGNGGLTQGAGAVLTLGGTSGITTLTATANPNTVSYGGAAQIVKATVYNNLTLSGSGAKTLAGVSTVNGDLTLSGTASATLATALNVGGSVTIGAGTTLDVSAANFPLSVRGNWSSSGTFNPRSGTVTFNGTGAQTIDSANTWYGLAVTAATARTVAFESGVAQTIAANGSLTLTGAAGNLLTLAPTTPASYWLLNVNPTGVTQTITNVSVSYSDARGGAQINASAASNVDGGHVPNWLFAGNSAPNAPSAINQYKIDGITVIAQGGYTNDASVVFKATATDVNNDLYKLDVEVVLNAGVFTNGPTCSTALLASGSEASTGSCGTFANPNGYKWQYRLVDEHNAARPWTVFGGSDPDFSIDTVAPSVGLITPSNVTTATLVDGVFDLSASITESRALAACDYCASTTTPCNSWLPGSVAGSTPSYSCLVSNVAGFADGATVYLNVRGVDGAGNSAVGAEISRVVDSAGPTVLSTAPANGAADATVDSPVTIDWTDGAGLDCSTVTTSSVTIAPAGTWNLTSCSGNQAVFTPAGQSAGTLYTVTVTTGVRDLIGNAMAASHAFSYTTNSPPGAPSAIDQYRIGGVTAIAQGGFSNEASVVFKANTTDVDGDTYQLQVEVVLDASAFTNSATCSSALVASGSEASTGSCGLFADASSYKWQYRLVDEHTAATAWTASGASDPDFTIDAVAPSNGTLTASATSVVSIDLAWSGFGDSGSGLATSNTYRLVALAGAILPLANCSNGALIYLGSGASFVHGNRNPNTRYGYRLCAYDAAGNLSTGATATATTPAGNSSPGNGDPNAPAPLILNPMDGAVVSGDFLVQAQVYDPQLLVDIAAVELWIDGLVYGTMIVNPKYALGNAAAVYELVVSGLSEGSHELTVRAIDSTLPVALASGSVPASIALRAAAVGDGNLLVRDNAPQLCIDCHVGHGHGSQYSGGKYGAWVVGCRDCHTPHKTHNIALIKEQIKAPNFGGGGGSYSVKFWNKNGLGSAGSWSFVNPDPATNGYGPCQVCHTRTAYYPRADDKPAHFTTSCLDCHDHANGFK